MGFKKVSTSIILLSIIIISFFYWQKNDIVTTNINIENSKIPNSFDKFKILQVSDLHNKEFGKKQEKLLKLTKEVNPNIISLKN